MRLDLKGNETMTGQGLVNGPHSMYETEHSHTQSHRRLSEIGGVENGEPDLDVNIESHRSTSSRYDPRSLYLLPEDWWFRQLLI